MTKSTIQLKQHTYTSMCVCCLTSRVSAKDEFSDLIVNKDEETVRERTEPPTGPERERREWWRVRAELWSTLADNDEEHSTT